MGAGKEDSFQMSQVSEAWGENGSGNFSLEEKGFYGFAAISASPESRFVLYCSCCQRGYFHQKPIPPSSNNNNRIKTEISFPMPQLVPTMYGLRQDFAVGNGDFFLMFSKKLKFIINMVVFLTLPSISHV